MTGIRDLYSFDMELDIPDFALQAKIANTADNWHRRMGHINANTLEFLNKMDDQGMHFVVGLSACDVYAIG